MNLKEIISNNKKIKKETKDKLFEEVNSAGFFLKNEDLVSVFLNIIEVTILSLSLYYEKLIPANLVTLVIFFNWFTISNSVLVFISLEKSKEIFEKIAMSCYGIKKLKKPGVYANIGFLLHFLVLILIFMTGRTIQGGFLFVTTVFLMSWQSVIRKKLLNF